MSAAKKSSKSSGKTAPLDLRLLIPGMPLPGGIFAGLIYPKGVAQALIAGPEYDGALTWDAAMKWAKSLKVDGFSDFTLPLRREQSLAFANIGDQFQPRWYWSCEQHASDTVYAWFQLFSNGDQRYWSKVNVSRGRAFRRLVIQ